MSASDICQEFQKFIESAPDGEHFYKGDLWGCSLETNRDITVVEWDCPDRREHFLIRNKINIYPASQNKLEKKGNYRYMPKCW